MKLWYLKKRLNTFKWPIALIALAVIPSTIAICYNTPLWFQIIAVVCAIPIVLLLIIVYNGNVQ